MASLRQRPADALLEQSAAVLEALRDLGPVSADADEVAGRLVALQRSLRATVATPVAERALPLPAVLTLAAVAPPHPATTVEEAVAELSLHAAEVAAALGPDGLAGSAVVRTPGGAATRVPGTPAAPRRTSSRPTPSPSCGSPSAGRPGRRRWPRAGWRRRGCAPT